MLQKNGKNLLSFFFVQLIIRPMLHTIFNTQKRKKMCHATQTGKNPVTSYGFFFKIKLNKLHIGL